MSSTCGSTDTRSGEPCQRGPNCPHHPGPSPAGRHKLELTDAQVELIERMATFGLTQAQIADCLPMSERTLRKRIRNGEHPDIAAAYARGRSRDARTLSERHRDMALGKIEDVSTSEQRKAIQWRLERQHGWSDTMVHEHSGPGGGAIPTEVRVKLVSADAGDG